VLISQRRKWQLKFTFYSRRGSFLENTSLICILIDFFVNVFICNRAVTEFSPLLAPHARLLLLSFFFARPATHGFRSVYFVAWSPAPPPAPPVYHQSYIVFRFEERGRKKFIVCLREREGEAIKSVIDDDNSSCSTDSTNSLSFSLYLSFSPIRLSRKALFTSPRLEIECKPTTVNSFPTF
jgi:hypothetical protein